jgi:hypothetical protein
MFVAGYIKITQVYPWKKFYLIKHEDVPRSTEQAYKKIPNHTFVKQHKPEPFEEENQTNRRQSSSHTLANWK